MKKQSRYTIFTAIALLTALSGCFGSKTAQSSVDMGLLQGKANIMPVAVIGSGPAGLMAAVYGARGGKDTYVLEGNKPGGLLMDTTEVANWPGEIMITGPKIIEKMRNQALHQGVNFVEDAVERIDTSSWPYAIHTENGDILHAMSIIIATGAAPKRLNIPGEDEYWGAGVTACAVCDAPFYKGLEVVVIGGGDSAVEEAIQLSSYASKITILVRKDRMRAAESMQERLKGYPSISIKYNVEPRKIVGDGTEVTGIELFNVQTHQHETFPTSGVFLAIGHNPNTSFLKGSIPLTEGGNVIVKGRTQETLIHGIFSAGDVEDHRYRQAGTSAGYGIAAGLDAVRFLDDNGYNPAIAAQIKPQLFGKSVDGAQELDISQGAIELESLDELDQLLAKHEVVIADFWTKTCPSCKVMLPHFRSIAQEMSGQVAFVTIDAEEASDISEKYFVNRVPLMLVFKDGQIVSRHSGPLSKKELSSFVEQFASN